MLSPLLLAALSPSATAGIVKGPFLQQATPDSITVAWQTDNETTGEVAYGLTPGMGLTATSPSGTLHHVELTGLQRSKVYHYQVTSGGETPAAATFATAPHDEEPFRFVIVGDTRTDTDAHQVVVDQLLGSVGAPDLYLNTGDLVEDGGDSSQWQDFFDFERELMAVAPLYPVANSMVLELTERAQLGSDGGWESAVNYLRNVGFRIALDDVGAGYNSLGAVAAVTPEVIKLDISLIAGIHRNAQKAELVKLLADYAERRHIRTVAEGIETAEEERACKSLGVQLLQGYHLGRPVPLSDCMEKHASKLLL